MNTIRKLTGKKAAAGLPLSADRPSKSLGKRVGAVRALNRKKHDAVLSPQYEMNRSMLKKVHTQFDELMRLSTSVQAAISAYYAAQSVLAGSWDSHGKLASTSTELRILGISSQQCQIVKEMVIQLFLEHDTLRKLSEVETLLDIAGQESMMKSGESMKMTVDSFCKTHLQEAKQLVEGVNKSIAKMDAKEHSMNEAVQKPDSHLNLFNAHTEYQNACRKFKAKYLETSNLLEDINTERTISCLDPLISLYSGCAQFADLVYDKLEYMDRNFLVSLDVRLKELEEVAAVEKRREAEARASKAQSAEKNKFDALLEVLCDGIADVVMNKYGLENPEFTDSIVRSLDAYGMCVEQIHAALLTDLEGIKGPQQVMRANTYGSKITLSYCRKSCFAVMECMVPAVLALIESPMRYEYSMALHLLSPKIDPVKLQESGCSEEYVLEDNIQSLIAVANDLLTSVIDGLPLFPRTMREILKYLYEHVDQKFPGKGGIGVVGVIFLRLLSPTLVFPVKNGLIELAEGETLSKEARRALTLVSKILQNLANDTKFKEDYLEPVNCYLEDNRERLQSYIEEIVVVPETLPPTGPLASIEEVNERDLPFVYHLILTHLEDLCTKLQADGKRDLCLRLVSILGGLAVYLGDPLEEQQQEAKQA